MSASKYFLAWMIGVICTINAQCASNNAYCLIGNKTWDRNIFGGTDISHYMQHGIM